MNDYDNFFISTVIFFIIFSNLLFILYLKRKSIPSGKAKIILINTLSTLYLVFVVFIIGESYYRFFVDRTDSFSISKISSRWMERHYQFNQQDYRDNIDYFSTVEKGKYRMSIFGDSFTAGHGVENVNNRFSNILRNKYPNLEVHNFSKNGAHSQSQLERMKILREEGYQFNIIVLSYCLNDIDYLVKDAAKIYDRIHSFHQSQSYLVKQSYFINNLSFRLFSAFDPDIADYTDFLLQAFEGDEFNTHLRDLKAIIDFSKEINVPLVTVSFPFLHTNYEEYQFTSVHQALDKFWKSNNIPHLDLLNNYKDNMGNNLTVNPFDAHPNELAHQIAADAIDKFFLQSPKAAQ